MLSTSLGILGNCASLGIGNLQPSADASDWDALATEYARLIEAGCRLVDTAQCYGASETFIGSRLRHLRGRMLLVSKCGHHEVLADGSLRSRPITMADIDGALVRLETDHLDGMLLHSYDLEPLRQGTALEVLRSAKRAGKVRAIGYSGDGVRAAWAIDHGDIDLVEMSLNLADQDNRALAERAAARNIGVIAKRPLANAAWRFAEPALAPSGIRPYAERLQALAYDHRAHGCASMGELALRFVIALPAGPVAIAASRNRTNQDELLGALRSGPLPADAVAAISHRFASLSAGSWNAHN